MTAVEWFAMITGAWKYASKAQLEQAKEIEKQEKIEFACKVYEERMQTHGGDTLEIANKLINL
jgi:hypothetical protein